MKYLWLFSVLFLLTGCTVQRTVADREQMLTTELARLQSFHMEGMAEVRVKPYALRKYFVVQKSSRSIQFELMDSGILGLDSKPFLTVRADSVLTIDTEKRDLVAAILKKAGLMKGQWSDYLDFQALLREHRTEIVEHQQATLGDYELGFTPRMQLGEIHSKDGRVNIHISYSGDDPTEMIIRFGDYAETRFHIEQFIQTSCCEP